MSRTWLIIAREYLENVRTKAFLLGIVLTPLWFALVLVIPRLARESQEQERVVILDLMEDEGRLATSLRVALEEVRDVEGEPRYDVAVVGPAHDDVAPRGDLGAVGHLRLQASQGDLVAVVLTPAVLEKRSRPVGGEPAPAVLGPSSVGAIERMRVIQATVNELVNRRLLAERDVSPDVADLLARPAVPVKALDKEGNEGNVALAIAPFVFMILLYMGIMGIGQMLMSTTIEEKASRVYEVLLSSVSPFQLMAGKVLGVCAVGFTLLALWMGGGLAAASLQGVDGLVSGGQLGLFVAYYLLGFLLIASLMVAVGSACNTLKEAQNLMAPLSLLLALPLVLAIVVMRSPNGTLATVASFIPPFTPFLMMSRIASVPGPPTWQIVASLLLLVVSTWVAVRLAARIFRVGILMYGKPPRLGEVWRWMRSPD